MTRVDPNQMSLLDVMRGPRLRLPRTKGASHLDAAVVLEMSPARVDCACRIELAPVAAGGPWVWSIAISLPDGGRSGPLMPWGAAAESREDALHYAKEDVAAVLATPAPWKVAEVMRRRIRKWLEGLS